MTFVLDDDVGEWNGGDRFRSHLFNGLSVLLPGGERLFIDTTRAALPAIDDAALAADCRGFIAQEAAHSLQHRRYNDRLRDAGHPIVFLERLVAFQIRLLKAMMSLRWQAGFSAASEHFTALIADAALSNPAWLDGADNGFGELWMWHSAEEIEHKSVAFDIFTELGGGYSVRIATMCVATAGLMVNLTGSMLCFMCRDLSVLKPSVWKDGIVFVCGRSGIFGALMWRYLDYYKPGFHPWQQKNRHLLERWKLDTND